MLSMHQFYASAPSGYLHELGHEAVAVGGALACAVAVGVDGVER